MGATEYSLDCNFIFDMSLNQRFLLAATLILLLFGLTAHAVPISLCECATALLDNSNASNPDFCLVCQLQTAFHKPHFSTVLNPLIAFNMSGEYSLNSLDLTYSVLRPPIA